VREALVNRQTNIEIETERHKTASFLQKFIPPENILCTLFANDARRQLHNIFKQCGTNINTACQLRNAIYIIFLITFNPGCALKFGYNCMLVKFI